MVSLDTISNNPTTEFGACKVTYTFTESSVEVFFMIRLVQFEESHLAL